jgi:hypothetical protein
MSKIPHAPTAPRGWNLFKTLLRPSCAPSDRVLGLGARRQPRRRCGRGWRVGRRPSDLRAPPHGHDRPLRHRHRTYPCCVSIRVNALTGACGRALLVEIHVARIDWIKALAVLGGVYAAAVNTRCVETWNIVDFHSFHCPYLIVLCKSEYGGQHCGQLERLALVVMAQ